MAGRKEEYMIKIENVSKSYDRLVLNNVNLCFGDTGLICLLGESGSGKSTLLNLIAGFDKPDNGSIYVNGINIDSYKSDYYHQNIVSVIFQNYNLIESLNVYDNVGLKKDKSNVDKVLDTLGIFKLKRKRVKYLSGGEAQRCAIARCLLSDTKIILADEPTGALDSVNSDKIMEILKDVSREKLVIVVTHNEELAKKYADNIIRIKDGCIKGSLPRVKNEVSTQAGDVKRRLKFTEMFKITMANFMNNKVRNILTVIAFMIGLFSYALIMAINNGFSSELDSMNVNTFYSYPLIISKESIIDSFNTDFEEREDIKIRKGNIVYNEINKELLDKINDLDDEKYDAISFYREVDSEFKRVSHVIPNYEFFELIRGNYPKSKEEVLLLIDEENSISEEVYNYINVDKGDFINTKIKVNGKVLKIVGVVKSKHEYFKSLSGILYSNDLFDSQITDIYIYPNSLDNKNYVKEELSDYYVLDNAQSIVDMTGKLVDGITLVLSLFSFVSLMVSVIMIMVISYISVLERQREIGILKSIGVGNRDIKRLFLFNNYIIAGMACLLSIILLESSSIFINKFVYNYVNIASICKINYMIIIKTISISYILSYIAGYIPSKIASKKKIIDIINNIS